jgi:hypothetical protein
MSKRSSGGYMRRKLLYSGFLVIFILLLIACKPISPSKKETPLTIYQGKIETNEWGQIVMTPTHNKYGVAR